MARDEKILATKRLMGALLRMPPKLHSEMKLGRNKRVASEGKSDSTAPTKKGGRRPSKHG